MEKSMEELYGRMDKCYAENKETIDLIIDRYVRMYEYQWKEPLGKEALIGTRMDVMCLGLDPDCDFLVLLESDDFSFIHDIDGIYRHLNRKTGEMMDCFVPRCCRGTSRKEANA